MFWIEFSATTDPIRPVQGDEVKLQLTVRQSGPFLNSQGDVWIVDSYGSSLAKVNSPDWGGQSEISLSTEIIWPKGSNVALQALWHVDGPWSVTRPRTSRVSVRLKLPTSGLGGHRLGIDAWRRRRFGASPWKEGSWTTDTNETSVNENDQNSLTSSDEKRSLLPRM